jgi:hypothetical protein
VLVTYGFPKGKRGSKHLGQCWYRVTPDGKSVIFMAVRVDDAARGSRHFDALDLSRGDARRGSSRRV